ncbi:ABC transporter, ATP-binding subunit [Sesbania bispinosa]|nr:ABC transporter, ATP-binding subunit [Sesbania bispinosa]
MVEIQGRVADLLWQARRSREEHDGAIINHGVPMPATYDSESHHRITATKREDLPLPPRDRIVAKKITSSLSFCHRKLAYTPWRLEQLNHHAAALPSLQRTDHATVVCCLLG